MLVTPEKFKALGLNFNAFVNVVHNKNKEGLIFYYEKVAKDLLPILQHYYAKNPAQIQTISVQDLFDFNELINKTTIIEGNDKKSICNRELGGLYDLKNEIGQSNDALKVGYSALDLNKIADAYEQIPYQTGCAECSVNAAARALILTGANIHSDNYSSFVANCPTIGETVNNISRKSVVGGWATGLLGAILCAIPGGQVVGMPMAVTGVSVMGAAGVSTGLTDSIRTAWRCGVDPWDLSNYIDRYLTNAYKYSYVSCYNDFGAYAATVAQDINNHQPVIAFFFFKPTNWHYANIVAIKEDNGCISEFIMLDTLTRRQTKIFKIITRENMEYLTRNIYKTMTSLALWNKPNYNYYLIRFQKS